ncbi:MAG: hypothetical protein R3C56_27060 [Pirellulaceae bacterium]
MVATLPARRSPLDLPELKQITDEGLPPNVVHSLCSTLAQLPALKTGGRSKAYSRHRVTGRKGRRESCGVIKSPRSCVPPWTWEAIRSAMNTGIESYYCPHKRLPELDVPLELMSYPHEVIAANMRYRQRSGASTGEWQYRQLQDGVFVAEGAAWTVRIDGNG